jgi:hypothetical protein
MKKYLPEVRKARVEENKARILAVFFEQSEEIGADGALKLKPVSRKWSEIKKLAPEAGISSDSGLAKILFTLKKEGKLLHDERMLWMPTAMAIEKAQKNIWHISDTLQKLRENEAFYWHGGDPFGLFKSGFSTDNVIDFTLENTRAKNAKLMVPKINAITTMTKTLQNYAFELLVDNIKNKNLDINDFKSGKTIQAIEIDWNKFRTSFKRIQNFIGDINADDSTPEAVLSDPMLDLDSQKRDVLNDLWFLVYFSSKIGDAKFKRKLILFLNIFTQSEDFYKITKVSSKSLETLMRYLGTNRDPLKDQALVKDLMVPDSTGFGYTDISGRYSIAMMLFKFGDASFMEKVEEFDNRLRELKIKRLNERIAFSKTESQLGNSRKA